MIKSAKANNVLEKILMTKCLKAHYILENMLMINCSQAHEFGVEKEEEPELELSADEQAVVEKVTKATKCKKYASPNKYYIRAACCMDVDGV